MSKRDYSYNLFIILFCGFITILLILLGEDVHASGFITYNEVKEYNNQEYYLYNIPDRYIGQNNGNQVGVWFYRGDGSFMIQSTKVSDVMNNQWVGSTFRSNLEIDTVGNKPFTSNRFAYKIDALHGSNFDNQAYLSIVFFPGVETTGTDNSLFSNGNVYNSDYYYDFDFDIYTQITDYHNNVQNIDYTWLWNNQVSYNLQGNQCYHKDAMISNGTHFDSSCFASRYSGSFNNMRPQPEYMKTTYHVDHGKFATDSFKTSSLPSDIINGGSAPGLNYEFIYSMDQPFMCEGYACSVQYNFYISAPYNIKVWSTEKRLSYSGTLVSDTDDFNFSEDNICYEQDCSGLYESNNLIQQLFNINVFNDHGFGQILNSIRLLFEKILTPSSTCKNLDISLNIRNRTSNISLPCGYTFWHSQDMVAFKQVIDLVVDGLFAFFIGKKFYIELIKVANPDKLSSGTEVMDL